MTSFTTGRSVSRLFFRAILPRRLRPGADDVLGSDVKVFIQRQGNFTTVVLHEGGEIVGVGTTKRNPADPPVHGRGTRIAAARALRMAIFSQMVKDLAASVAKEV